MKRRLLISALSCCLAIGALLLSNCSQRGAHMPRHRKSRHCDCPAFSMNTTAPSPRQTDSCTHFHESTE